MKIIVGLGNPGEKYAKVRHNLGFVVLDEFRHKGNWGDWEYEGKSKSEIVRTSLRENLDSSLRSELKTDQLILAKPQTYMNNSGMAVVKLVGYFKIDPAEDLIIVHDDLDLPLGKIKVRLGGAAAGHHGVESIINALGTDKFIRIRLGIGNLKTQSAEHKKVHVSAEKYVLEPFIHSEKPKVKHMIKQSIKAIDILLGKGLTVAQNQYN